MLKCFVALIDLSEQTDQSLSSSEKNLKIHTCMTSECSHIMGSGGFEADDVFVPEALIFDAPVMVFN